MSSRIVLMKELSKKLQEPHVKLLYFITAMF